MISAFNDWYQSRGPYGPLSKGTNYGDVLNIKGPSGNTLLEFSLNQSWAMELEALVSQHGSDESYWAFAVFKNLMRTLEVVKAQARSQTRQV